ncbi:MAG: tetratricopeptide repeat protein [Anaerolineae bacterium]|nr:tetratricopeptide repeat protein [Anaerolineae bacterium]
MRDLEKIQESEPRQSESVTQETQTNIAGDVEGPVLSGQFNGPVFLYPVFKLIRSIDERVLKRLGLEQRVGFTLLAVLIMGMGVGLYFLLRPRQPTQMAGTFCIAVAGFTENDNPGKSKLGMELAQRISSELQRHLDEMDLDIVVEVWGPDQVRQIKGTNRDERAASVEEMAGSIGADIVVYGSVDTTRALWIVAPEFYVAVENFYEAEEVVGQYEIGTPFSVIGGDGTVTSVALNDALSPRVEVLSKITVGLARYATQQYERALETFQLAEGVKGLEDEAGVKQVLCLLAGNAAGKSGDVEKAEQYYLQAQAINPDYARMYAGLGNVRYTQATNAYVESKTDTAMVLLEESLQYYQQALAAPQKPALSDMESKVHFARGRIYLMQAIIEQGDMGQAAQELLWVIEEYDGNQTERLRERAAESHKLLGLIYRLSSQDEQAIAEYGKAIALVENIPQLRARMGEYYAALGEVYVDAGRLSDAVEAYQNALQFTYSADAMQQYQERLEEIMTQMEKP